jgi:hypothetical protein
MQTVRFFEDQGAPNNQRRLLIAIATCEDEGWERDGGRREAVRVATTEDATTYAVAYGEYMGQFEQQQEAEAEQQPV